MATIFAPITAIAKSAVAIVRISGSKTKEALKIITKQDNFKHQKISICKIYNPKDNQLIDSALVSFFAAPNSYTGEDVAELNLHGSVFILKSVIKILGEIPGLRIAEPGEFSKIAFLNNRIDLVQAEAVVDLINASTALQHRQALKQLQGELSEIYDNWRFSLIEVLALLEAYIDFPEDDLPSDIIANVTTKVSNLVIAISSHLDDQRRGQKIKEGINIAIIGAPNVGKSSLINYLTKKEVAIVSEIAGTTRDIVETHLSIANCQVNISDTAGLRLSRNKIEKEGIKRALKKASESDIKIFVFDAQNLDERYVELIDDNSLIVVNKIDLVKKDNFISHTNHLEKLLKHQLKQPVNPIFISIKSNLGLDNLYQKLEELVIKLLPDNDSLLITEERYRKYLTEACSYLSDFNLQKNIELAAEDLRMATKSIAKITGRVEVDNILEVIFSRFCIGK